MSTPNVSGIKPSRCVTVELKQVLKLIYISSQYVDPAQVKYRHLFFSLMRIFVTDYALMCLTLLVQAFSWFVRPFAIKELLRHCCLYISRPNTHIYYTRYIEMDGRDMSLRPFVWIILMFLGYIVEAMSMEWYTFVSVSDFLVITLLKLNVLTFILF
jgi:hypothetical protein